jgi:hypothetical protein
MFAPVNKRFFIVALFFLAYGTWLAHNLVPHTHHEEIVEHHADDHHHSHEDQDENGSLGLFLADVIHLAGTTGFYLNHTTSSFFKISFPLFIEPSSELAFKPPVNSSSKHPPSFREERILSFSITNASLRAPPVA